jgi:phospholipid/cholesterol/gamma-HCH transport system substrate-binding protein
MISSPEFKVGALVVIVSGLIGLMSLKVNEGPGLFSRTKRYWFDLQDAGGLVDNSAVKAAGIKVGVIEKIKLVDDKARVYVLIDGDMAMRSSGYVELRSDGILGDRHVELVAGDIKDPELEDGSQILTAYERGSINALMKEVGKITESVSRLADTLNKATGPEGDMSTSLGRIVHNIENLTADLSQMTGQNKGKINEIVDNVQSLTKQLDKFISDESPEGFAAGWEKAVASLSRIDTSLRNIEEITGKINRGEGTIGRLVNDEETVEKINEAVGNFNDFVGGASQLETSFDFHSEYLTDAELTKSYLNVKIQPGLDRYYELGVVDDPRGVQESTDIRQSGSQSEDYNETRTFKNKIKFNALFAKNFYDFTVKGGLIENTGGLGFDYYLFKRDLRLSVEAFDFDDVVLRAYMRYNLFKGFYLVGGGDNLANSDLRSGFVGAGLFITNDDLKFLAGKVNF